MLWTGHWFGHEVRDEFDYQPDATDNRDGKTVQERSKAWTNYIAFLAHYTIHAHEFTWLYGFWAIRKALEPELGLDVEAFLPAAAAWIAIAGTLLHKMSREQDENPEAKGDGRLKELSLKRWGEWKLAFQRAAEGEKMSDEMRLMAGDAARKMGLN